MIESAKITAPNKKNFTINSKKQKVVEISRRELDKQIAFQAQKNGATITEVFHLKNITRDSINQKFFHDSHKN